MSSVTATRPKSFKSQIPVLVKKVKSSNTTCKENNIHKKLPPLSVASNVNKTVAKNSNLLQKEPKRQCKSQVKVLSLSTYKGNKTCVKTRPISQTVNTNKTTSKNCHLMKKEQVNKCNFQIEKPLTDRNVKNSKYKSTSKNNTQTTVKANIICEQNKNKNLSASNLMSKKEKENQETSNINYFSAQKDIKFEANEFFRKMILSERELSPSICKMTPGLKLSLVQAQRPSIYQKFEVHPNPFQEALQAIANASAKRGNKKTSVQNEKKISAISPFKERNSFYTPCADPKLEVMKSLEAFKAAKQMQKSSLKNTKKKVTFNLNVKEYTAKIDCDSEQIPSKSSECKLTQINERSAENSPSSPVMKTPGVNSGKQLSEFQNSSISINAANRSGNLEEHLQTTIHESSEISTPVSSTVSRDGETKNLLPVEYTELSLLSLKETDPISLSPDFVCINTRLPCETLDSQRPTSHPTLLEKNIANQNVKTSQAKLCTPRPISYYSNSRLLNDSPSPDFLIEKTSKTLSNLAPIYTPLVLKNMAKSSGVSPDADLNPIRLKLDFTVMERDTPKKETSIKSHASLILEKVLTAQKKLDDLADQECSFWLSSERIPVVCGRYLQNPIAITLTEGDEMHFMPLRF